MFGLQAVVEKVIGTRSERMLKTYQPLLSRVNALESKMQGFSDDQLKGLAGELRQQLENGSSTDDILPQSFAMVREVAVRTMGMRHYDVQILGGIVLHRGIVAEMKTGEGKTLSATLPVVLNGLSGKGVHVVTVNDYLASRDADWMSPIYNFLGMSVGKILSQERDGAVKKAAYAADITYGTNNEFGFDYLRDNMKFRIEDYVQRGHHYAIVDEVDSILIDEARTPLIISGPTNDNTERYKIVDGVVPLLQAEVDYVVTEKSRGVALTDSGVDKVETRLGVENLYDPHNMEILHHVNQALKAHTVFKRDRDYVVQSGKVVIVDEQTGRLMHGRRWSDGLHQAVEAKEKVNVENESQTYATITFQNYFRMYDKLSGMTGTADTEREEFQQIYNLDVCVVPTNRRIARLDEDDVIYKTQGEKYRAVLDDIEDRHAKGQPILVGTVSVEKSEIVSRLLQQRGITHQVLNARKHAQEALIVAQAGRKGSVTISTNMAGRGTDIKLGGDPEGMAAAEADPENQPAEYAAAVDRWKVTTESEKQEVLDAGGLFILGTERHESRRIDNQLRGRSGRQGDPGASRFYLSLEDDLLRIFGGEKLVVWMEKMGLQDDEPIEHRLINRSIENAQKKVEGHNFNIRKNLLEYDDVMNLQRRSVYSRRRQALEGQGIEEMMNESIEALVEDVLDEHARQNDHPENWDVDALRKQMDTIFQLSWSEPDDQIRDMAWEEVRLRIIDEIHDSYRAKCGELGDERVRQVERMLILQFTDQYWKDHLLAMDRLRDGIGLRGYGQRNPLLEYKREGTSMFHLMNSMRDEAVVSRVLRLMPSEDGEVGDVGVSKAAARRLAQQLPGSDQSESGASPALTTNVSRRAAAAASIPEAPRLPTAGDEARIFALINEIRRNDPCPCGSGKKHKKCCYQRDWEPPAEVAKLIAARQKAREEAVAAREAALQTESEPGVASKEGTSDAETTPVNASDNESLDRETAPAELDDSPSDPEQGTNA